MEFKVAQKKEQALLYRTELKGTVAQYTATPSAAELRKVIAGTVKVNEDQVVVSHINGKFGKRSADVLAYIYKDPKKKELVELKLGKKALAKVQKEAGQEKQETKEAPQGQKKKEQ